MGALYISLGLFALGFLFLFFHRLEKKVWGKLFNWAARKDDPQFTGDFEKSAVPSLWAMEGNTAAVMMFIGGAVFFIFFIGSYFDLEPYLGWYLRFWGTGV